MTKAVERRLHAGLLGDDATRLRPLPLPPGVEDVLLNQPIVRCVCGVCDGRRMNGGVCGESFE